MQVEVKKIIKYCEDYLHVSDFEDKCHNGLQLEGADKTSKIITGVSLSEQLVKAAIKKRAKLILVHHGLFNSLIPYPIIIKGTTKKRLKLLLENNINLAGFHLPLDAHKVIGNNVSICKELGINKVKPFEVGYIGELDKEINFIDLVNLVEEKLQTNTYAVQATRKKVKTIAVVSGGASPWYEKAREAGADTYITGDIREEIIRGAEEIGINIINAWHYNTEKLGIQNLCKLVEKKFGIKVEFVDIPNDV